MHTLCQGANHFIWFPMNHFPTSSFLQIINKWINATAAQMLSEEKEERKKESALLSVISDPVTQCCGGIGSTSC